MPELLCPYCCEDMDTPEEGPNGVYVDPWHCEFCGATETDWRSLDRYTEREVRVTFAYGDIPSPNALHYKTLTILEYLEEIVCHANSSSK